MRYEAKADVLVIGGGIAGAFAAIKAKEKGADVLLAAVRRRERPPF